MILYRVGERVIHPSLPCVPSAYHVFKKWRVPLTRLWLKRKGETKAKHHRPRCIVLPSNSLGRFRHSTRIEFAYIPPPPPPPPYSSLDFSALFFALSSLVSLPIHFLYGDCFLLLNTRPTMCRICICILASDITFHLLLSPPSSSSSSSCSHPAVSKSILHKV